MLSLPRTQGASERTYTQPQLHEGKEWFVDFYAFDASTGKLRRKKIKINEIRSIPARRKFGRNLCLQLSEQLSDGWNPWQEEREKEPSREFGDVMNEYTVYVRRLRDTGALRRKTAVDYLNRLMQLRRYEERHRVGDIVCFDRRYVSLFLDHIFLERHDSPITRNNYLTWLSTLSTWLVEKGYVERRPTDGIKMLHVQKRDKQRRLISPEELSGIADYLRRKDPHYLLVCYLIYYLFIRPKELSYIRIGDISVKNRTLVISGDYSKNRTTQVVTLPEKVLKLMLELGVLNCPVSYYLVGKRFRPNARRHSEAHIRYYWKDKVRPALNLTFDVKFYSLKDSGITNMIRSGTDLLSVRDQARHSSVEITDAYTPTDARKANPELMKYEDECF